MEARIFMEVAKGKENIFIFRVHKHFVKRITTVLFICFESASNLSLIR